MQLGGEAGCIDSFMCITFSVTGSPHTSIIHGGLGLMYGTYVGFGRSLRNWNDQL